MAEPTTSIIVFYTQNPDRADEDWEFRKFPNSWRLTTERFIDESPACFPEGEPPATSLAAKYEEEFIFRGLKKSEKQMRENLMKQLKRLKKEEFIERFTFVENYGTAFEASRVEKVFAAVPASAPPLIRGRQM